MFEESVMGLVPFSRGAVLRSWTLSERGGRGDEERGESVIEVMRAESTGLGN